MITLRSEDLSELHNEDKDCACLRDTQAMIFKFSNNVIKLIVCLFISIMIFINQGCILNWLALICLSISTINGSSLE